MIRPVETEIERLTSAIDQHHFGAGPNDKPFCSCGWTGEPSDNWLSAERQFGRHLATSLVLRGGRFGGNWADSVRAPSEPWNDPSVQAWLIRLTNHAGATAEVRDAALVLHDWIKP